MKRRTSVSSSCGPSLDAADSGAWAASSATSLSRRRRADSLRMWSAIRRKATCVSQARGLFGRPSRGHCIAAASDASWTASSAAAKSRNLRTTVPEHLRRQFPQQVLDRNVRGLSRHSNSSGGPLITWRTSMGWFPRSFRARRRRSPRGDPIRLLRAFHVNDPVSGEKLLGLREDPIGDRRPVASRPNDLGLVGERQAFGCDEHAGILEFLVEGVHESEMRLEVLLRPCGVPVKIGLRARHHAACTSWVFLPSISAPGWWFS